MVYRAWLLVGLGIFLGAASSAECRAAEPADATVAAKDLRIGNLRVNKVLFLGNSITLHGPAPKIGWHGNWGMAASALEKDYVHLLVAKIAKSAGGQPEVKVRNIATFERSLDAGQLAEDLKDELAFNADVVIVAIGENAAGLTTDEDKARFSTAFAALLAELKSHGNPTVFVRSQFWANTPKDQRMKQACLDAGGTYIDMSPHSSDNANYARSEREFEHAGVANHPGDKGMQVLADEIWKAIKARSLAEQTPQD